MSDVSKLIDHRIECNTHNNPVMIHLYKPIIMFLYKLYTNYSIHSEWAGYTLTCIGSCILNTGTRAGRMRLEYSCIEQSSDIKMIIGRTNGIILWLRNSATNGGRTL